MDQNAGFKESINLRQKLGVFANDLGVLVVSLIVVMLVG